MEVNIRPLQTTDLAQVRELAVQLGYSVTASDLALRFKEMEKFSPSLQAFVASKGNVVLGWIEARREFPTLLDGQRAEISALVVDEKHRSLGIGHKLLAAAEDWATKQDLHIMRVRTNVLRERAHAFYRREGYDLKKSWHLFVKAI